MVVLVTKPFVEKRGTEDPGLVVELIGPAAVGKSTLIRALSDCDERFELGLDLERRKFGHILYFLTNLFRSLPTLLKQYRNGRWFTGAEIKMIVYLMGWHRQLRGQAERGAIPLLQNGPAFKLVRLHAFGPDHMKSQSFDGWWERMLKQWATTLDIVIWLDAPDEVLLDRVRARDRWHALKMKSETEAHEFLARYRKSYERIIPVLVAEDGPSLLRFDTDQESPSQIIDKVLAEIDFGHRQG